MAVVLRQSIAFDVNSDPAGGAELLTDNNAQFEINLQVPISIPGDAKNATLRVEEATVWNTVANISAGLGNNQFVIDDNTVVTALTIPDGSYSVQDLSAAINREFVDAGGTANLVLLAEDSATQRVVMVLDGTLSAGAGVFVDLTGANTCRDVLGYNNQIVPLGGGVTILTEDLAPNVAAFNNIEYFLLHADVTEGIRVNNTWNNTVGRVNITAPPGSQVVSTPFNPAKSSVSEMVGSPRRHFVFWITDQSNVQVDTGEIWSMRMVFEWDEIQILPVINDKGMELEP